jgi:hypothetical protein
MAIRLAITAKEVKAEKIVKPGWYPTKILKVTKEIAKDKESENFVVDVEGLEGDASGVPCKVFFSEKFIQSINPLVRATSEQQGIPTEKVLTEEAGIDPNYDLEKIVGATVDAKWVTNRGKSGDDKPRNAIDDWAPLKAGSPFYQGPPSSTTIGAAGFGG